MDDQTRANDPDANLTGRNSDSAADDLPPSTMPADVQSSRIWDLDFDLDDPLLPYQDTEQPTPLVQPLDLEDLQPRPAPVSGHAGNGIVDTSIWRMLSPILFPIPFAIVIFLFSLLA